MAFRDDILAQPGNLLRSSSVFLAALARADLSPWEKGPLLFTGMGASLFATVTAASALRAADRPAFALSAAEMLGAGGGTLGWPCVGISQSGRSAETVDAFQRLAVPRLGLTNTGAGPLADVADLALPIGSAEDGGISVQTHTASLFAVASLAARLGAGELELEADRLSSLLAELIEQAEPIAERFAERLDGIRALDVIGDGTSQASAGYTALLMREAAWVPTAWFDTRQYLHGPIEVAEPAVGAVLFGNGREVRLAQDLAGYGVAVLLVTEGDARAHGTLEVLRLPRLAPLAASILQAVPGQCVAEVMARRRGVSAGSFRHHQEDTKTEVG